MLQVGAEVFFALARTAGADDRGPLWERMVAIFPKYAVYQAKTSREIPVVVLEPNLGVHARI